MAQTCRDWAEESYKVPVDLSALEHIYQGRWLTAEVVGQLNANLMLDDLANEVDEIGYPVHERGAV